jgi:hypothetical protein
MSEVLLLTMVETISADKEQRELKEDFQVEAVLNNHNQHLVSNNQAF